MPHNAKQHKHSVLQAVWRKKPRKHTPTRIVPGGPPRTQPPPTFVPVPNEGYNPNPPTGPRPQPFPPPGYCVDCRIVHWHERIPCCPGTTGERTQPRIIVDNFPDLYQ